MEASYQGGVTLEETGTRDNFQSLTQTITSNIKKISQNVSSITKMVNQLQTPQDSQELRNQLRQIQHYTQKLAKDTSSLLIELMRLPADQPAKMMRERLGDEFMTTLNAFQATQRSAAQKTKQEVKKVRAQNVKIGDPFAMSSGTEESLIDMEGSGAGPKQKQLTATTENELQELEQREQDIRQLEGEIMDVNHIFKELGQMIHDQGHVVDSIEASVECAAQGVSAGAQELNKAATYKNNLRKKKVYIAVVLIIVISIILIIVFRN